MGLLVKGQWVDKWYDTKASKGEFVRSESKFRNWIYPDSEYQSNNSSHFPAQAGRYHLYVSLACPWAHRALVFIKLKQLEEIISISCVHPDMLENGWEFKQDDNFNDSNIDIGDPLHQFNFAYQLYTKAKPNYSGRVTVPILWDKKRQTIVSNESSEIIRIFNRAFDDMTGNTLDFYPESKANEIVAAPQLLDYLDLTGCVVTGDAMFTQRELCIQIVEAGGHFILPVKGNQKTVQHAIADAFMPAQVAKGHQAIGLEESFVESTSIGHGRIEKRYLTVTSDLNDYLDFPHIQQVFRLQRVIQHQATGKLSYQVIFGITSLSREQCAPEKLLALVRSHWHIENRLHYVRDVTFHEDDCQIRDTKRQRLLATLNNLVIGLIRGCDQFDYVPEARRYFDANYDEAFQLIT